MIPYKVINDRGLPDAAKKIAIAETLKLYEPLKTEIIKCNATIIIDFLNNTYSLNWKVRLDNASNELLNKFNSIK